MAVTMRAQAGSGTNAADSDCNRPVVWLAGGAVQYEERVLQVEAAAAQRARLCASARVFACELPPSAPSMLAHLLVVLRISVAPGRRSCSPPSREICRGSHLSIDYYSFYGAHGPGFAVRGCSSPSRDNDNHARAQAGSGMNAADCEYTQLVI